jgi:acyl-CoA synthetase (AMP-forming)/AMP-acid ligase II
MLLPISTFGSIEDIGRGVRWDAPTFARQVERRAATLARMGIGKGAIVAIGHNGTAGFFADLIAVWSRGAAAACLDSSFTASETETILRFVQPAVFLTGGAAPPVSVPAVDLDAAESTHTAATMVESDPDDPALVLLTSGTTGTPKGVVLSFRAITARIEMNGAAIGRLARTLVTLPTHFGHGLIGNALTPFMRGGDLVLPPIGLSLAKDLGRVVDDYRITFLSSVPALWAMAMKFNAEPSRRSLLRVHVGSAPLSPALWSEIVSWSGADVINCYGMTETANWISGASSRADGIADGAVGRMWGGSAAVLDDDGQIRQTGIGEVLVQTPSLMSGYLRRPGLTASAMHEGWYRTGDRGIVSDSGHIRLVGRLKDEINRAGFKIQPAEIDALLIHHPAVAEACAFAIPDPVAGEVVAAAVKLNADTRETPETLRAWCRARLRREAVPERWFIVDDIPRNARGKVGREAVRRSILKDASHGAEAGRAAD